MTRRNSDDSAQRIPGTVHNLFRINPISSVAPTKLSTPCLPDRPRKSKWTDEEDEESYGINKFIHMENGTYSARPLWVDCGRSSQTHEGKEMVLERDGEPRKQATGFLP